MQPRATEAPFGVALFFAALVPRLWVALRWAGEPVWDGHYYEFGARRIAQGLGYSDDVSEGGRLVWHAWCHYPVGYSAFLGGCYRAFGSDLRVAPGADAIVAALLAALPWLVPAGDHPSHPPRAPPRHGPVAVGHGNPEARERGARREGLAPGKCRIHD